MLHRRLGWVPCAGRSTPERRWAGARLRFTSSGKVATRSNRRPRWSSRSPRTALFPDGCLKSSMSITVQALATGSRPPVGDKAPACRSTLPKGGSRRAGRPVGWRSQQVLTFPLDVNRNRAPAHLRSGVEWPAHGTQPSRAANHSTCAGRRQAPEPQLQFVHCDGRRRRPSQPRPQRPAGQPGRTVSLRQEGVLRSPITLNTRCSSDLFLNRMGGIATAATRSAIFL